MLVQAILVLNGQNCGSVMQLQVALQEIHKVGSLFMVVAQIIHRLLLMELEIVIISIFLIIVEVVMLLLRLEQARLVELHNQYILPQMDALLQSHIQQIDCIILQMLIVLRRLDITQVQLKLV
jgi:hypothetical protein